MPKPNPRQSGSNKVADKTFSYTVLFEPDETGGYVVTCPALPGLVTEGDTLRSWFRFTIET